MKIGLPQHALFERFGRLPVSVKILGLLAVCLGLSLVLTTTLFDHEMQRYRGQQQQQLSEQLGRQSAQVAATQILSKDWVSLTVTANQLIEHPQISGVTIVDASGEPLAQAGNRQQTPHNTPITLNGTELGEIQLYLDSGPLAQELSLAFYRTSLAAITTVLGCWLVLFVYLRRFAAPLAELVRATDELLHGDSITPLRQSGADELGRIAANLNQRFARPEPEVETEAPPALATAAETPAASPVAAGDSHCSDAATQTATTDASHSPSSLSPAAHYLFYVDHCSTASENLTADERARLLEPYRRSLEQVSHLYKGVFELDDEGNWWVGFNQLDNEHSHGINALCAAQLFNALYRGTNQRAIRQMQPVANIKMALLGGNESFAALLQEAPLLCRAVEANQLIVDEQLFSVPQLLQRLLQDAQCRSLEQPARLLSSLGPDYQTLIDQQAEHFLKQP
ncbi:HAMP domain-containing protein [Motiliproteus sediminis]|uniref:HAMP domain-containing protein n=1 Tax=Motiliproteus sediminis TaxID=1468178 RepID=UPI001AEFA66D|nr:HAMP domain-containing protein [Motiliproteus sediminis]